MKFYTPAELAKFAAVIARCATMCDWKADAAANQPGPQVQEVQCMMFDGKLYIAANRDEHTAVAAYLSGFGVHDGASFLKCIAYSHWLLSLDLPARAQRVGRGFNASYSPQEEATHGLPGTSPIPLLSETEQNAVLNLVTGALPQDAAQRRLAWFLRRFAGAPSFPKPPCTALPEITSNLGDDEIYLVTRGEHAHAELKLLALVYLGVRPNAGKWAHKTIHLGGLKKACKNCAAWMDHFRLVINAVDVQLALPGSGKDTRPDGIGAGNRPSVPMPPVTPATTHTHAYLQALFNGTANNGDGDLKPLRGPALQEMGGRRQAGQPVLPA